MHKHVYFRALIEEKLTTGECLTQLSYILLAMQLFKITRDKWKMAAGRTRERVSA